MGPVTTSPKPLRADAQRNHDALLAAGERPLARFGVDAPFEGVAREAGVGGARSYRRFPTRDHLFVAILQERGRFPRRESQGAAGRSPDAWQALSEWLRLFDQSATGRLEASSARLGSSLADDRLARSRRCAARWKANLAHLFERAKQETPLHKAASAIPLLAMISGLPKDPQSGKTLEPWLDIASSPRVGFLPSRALPPR